MCGGLGAVIGLVMFFAWKDSKNVVLRFIAWACLVCVLWSLFVLIIAITGQY